MTTQNIYIKSAFGKNNSHFIVMYLKMFGVKQGYN